jgi:hypothetical protein
LTDISWEVVPIPTIDLQNLDGNFRKRSKPASLGSDKAPGPDGFTGAFYKTCWDIVKPEIIQVIYQFSNLHVGNLH